MKLMGKPSRRVTWWLAGLALCLVAASSSANLLQPAQAQTLAFYPLVPTGLNNPVDIAVANDGYNRLFIVQQGGQIRIFDGTQMLATPFLNITSRVLSGGERGLLGLAFHPYYAYKGFPGYGQFFVNYTRAGDGATVVARYNVSATNPNVADFSSEYRLLTVAQPFSNHNGGQLKFGWDGYLYIGLGDGGSGGDPGNRSQNPNELLGKMLRIDVDSDDYPADPARNYGIPPSNPFVGVSGYRPEIWALGLRNPWRYSWDWLTGDWFIADVGQGAREEVSFQPWYSFGGENYGWVCCEGNAAYALTRLRCQSLPPTNPCSSPGTWHTPPIFDYLRSVGASITGGFVYRGYFWEAIYGKYIFADYVSRRIGLATYNDTTGTWSYATTTPTAYSISSFGQDEIGELYFVAHGANGGLYWIYTP